MKSIRIRRLLIALLSLALLAPGAALARTAQRSAAAPGQLETGGLSGCAQFSELWQTSELVPQAILSCQITAAESGKLVISADGYALAPGNVANSAYEAAFTVAVGAATKQSQYVDVASDSHDGNDQAVSLTAGAGVAAGSHTITFKAGRVSSTGVPVTVGRASLSVLFVPDSSAGIEVCFAQKSSWSNATTSATDVAQCSLTTASGGRVFIFGSGTAHLKDSAYEAVFTARQVGDTNNASDRYVNVAANANDGTDRAVATMATKLILSASTFSVALYGQRSIGSGTVGMRNASLVAVFVAAAGANPASYCHDIEDNVWNPSLYNFDFIIASCTLSLDQPGWLWMIGSGSAGHLGGAVGDSQITSMLRLDGQSVGAERKANVYPNGDDGADATTSSASMVRVGPGSHTVEYTGQKVRGDASKVVIRDGGLAVLFIPAGFAHIPAIIK